MFICTFIIILNTSVPTFIGTSIVYCIHQILSINSYYMNDCLPYWNYVKDGLTDENYNNLIEEEITTIAIKIFY